MLSHWMPPSEQTISYILSKFWDLAGQRVRALKGPYAEYLWAYYGGLQSAVTSVFL